MKRSIFLLLTCSLLFYTCRKLDQNDAPQAISGELSDKIVANDFNWSTQNTLQIQLTYPKHTIEQAGKINVLDAQFNPILSWFKKEGDKSINLNFLALASLDSLSVYSKSLGINHRFSSKDKDWRFATYQPKRAKEKARNLKNSACSTGNCDFIVEGNENNIEVAKNETWCISGNIGGNLTLKQNANLIICGHATLNNINIHGGNHTITISENGSLTVSNLNINNNIEIINHGLLRTSGGINNNNRLVNFGLIQCSGHFNINGKASFINSGNLFVSGNLNINKTMNNDGLVNVSGSVAVNGSAAFTNNCKLKVSGNYTINGFFMNYQYVKVTGKTTVNGNANCLLQNASILITKDLTLNSKKLESDGIGVIRISDNCTINNAKTISGFIDLCDENGIEIYNKANQDNFIFCESSVETNDCIEEGLNAGQSPPNNEELVYTYPSTGFAYRAFEDLWPSKGDYDFNDMVLKYQVQYEANEENNLTQIILDIEVLALGAGIQNGIAFQLLTGDLSLPGNQIFDNLSASNGAFIRENGAVIEVSSNLSEELPRFYSNVGQEHNSSDYYTIRLNASINPSANIKVYNLVPDLFIFRSNEKGREIHMPGHAPSTYANNNLLNSNQDRSATQGWYKSLENYPWAIEITGTDVFLHPRAGVNIVEAYPQFQDWISSSGEQFQEWYQSPVMEKVF